MVALLSLQFAMPKPFEVALFSLFTSVRQEGGDASIHLITTSVESRAFYFYASLQTTG